MRDCSVVGQVIHKSPPALTFRTHTSPAERAIPHKKYYVTCGDTTRAHVLALPPCTRTQYCWDRICIA